MRTLQRRLKNGEMQQDMDKAHEVLPLRRPGSRCSLFKEILRHFGGMRSVRHGLVPSDSSPTAFLRVLASNQHLLGPVGHRHLWSSGQKATFVVTDSMGEDAVDAVHDHSVSLSTEAATSLPSAKPANKR